METDVNQKSYSIEKEKSVVYICDDNYTWLTGASMSSLLKWNRNVHIFIIGADIQLENRLLLEDVAHMYGGNCSILDVPEKFKKNVSGQRWPVFTLARLYISDILPDCIKRTLYLDSDTLITNDIKELWEMDMKDKLFYGVKDCIGRRYKRNIGLAENDIYINGGVLLMNLDALRKKKITEEICPFLRNYYNAMSYFDQDVLNAVFRGKIGILPPEYNVMTIVERIGYKGLCTLRHPSSYYSRTEIDYAKEHPCIIHFSKHVLSIQPWFEDSDHPYAETFRYYVHTGPWKGKLRRERVPFWREKIAKGFCSSPKPLQNMLLQVMGFLHAVWCPTLRYRRGGKSGIPDENR